jgi:regulator of protease activity HflC (stomatin/prohibitin superfamily)
MMIKHVKALVLASVAVAGLSACSRVTPGNVGVRVDQYGSSAGVDKTPLGVGTYWTGPGVSIYEYPISTQTYTWTKSVNEGKSVNEEFSFQDKSGLIVAGDVSVAYHVDPGKAPILFQKYRMDMDGIIAGPLRNQVRSAVVNAASGMNIEEIYGPKKGELVAAAEKRVQDYFAPSGLVIEQLFWAGPIRIPENILVQINAKIHNEQEAQAAVANEQTVEANAKSTMIKAQADADSMRVKAEAIAKNPALVSYEWVQKWDGRMPNTVYCSSSTPCIQTGGK